MLQDVARGLVSVKGARDDYGVVIAAGVVDHAATESLRAQMTVDTQTSAGGFGFNAERVQFERIWTRENYATLMRRLYALPTDWRFFIKHRVFDALARVSTLSEMEVDSACDRVIGEYPELAAHHASHQA